MKKSILRKPNLPEDLREWILKNCRQGEKVTVHYSDMAFVIVRQPKAKVPLTADRRRTARAPHTL